MVKRAVSFFLIITLSLPFFISCSKKEKQVYENFNCFDTYSTLTVYGSNDEVKPFFDEFDKTLKRYHNLLDIYNTYGDTTNLKVINDNAGKEAIAVSKELFDVLEFGIEMHRKTNGKLNVAIGAVTSIWHKARENASVSPANVTFPTQDSIKEALSHTDINSVLLDQKTCSVKITDPKLSLDFGGIAKGYVASLLYNKLISLGCKSFLINLGGNVVSAGTKPDGSSWISAIENPFDEASLGYNKSVLLTNQTLVTSGSYQRFFVYEGKNYSHIIDSESGFPPEFFASVTVKAPSSESGLADALSTALFCMSFDEGSKLIASMNNVEALWIFNDGSYKISAGFGGTN